jgi:hypothetical protein
MAYQFKILSQGPTLSSLFINILQNVDCYLRKEQAQHLAPQIKIFISIKSAKSQMPEHENKFLPSCTFVSSI